MPLAIALVCLAATVRAQPVDAAHIRKLLDSPARADQAWGAHDAAILRDPSLRDILVDHLRRATPYADSWPMTPQGNYVAHLFDALIQVAGPVPVEVFLPFQDRWRPQVLILLSRQTGTENTLLDLRECVPKQFQLEWLAVNNLLLNMRSQVFFSRTLGETAITHTVEVQDGPVTPRGSGYGGSWASGGQPKPPAGFPELVQYYIEDHGFSSEILARGPWKVYYRRASPRDGPGPFHGSGDQGYHLEYLAAWNGLGGADVRRVFEPAEIVSGRMKLRSCVQCRITWMRKSRQFASSQRRHRKKARQR
jgi:hypothetical protein